MNPYKLGTPMIVTPGEEYTLTQLNAWFEQAQAEGQILVLDPCNPADVPFLRTKATIATRDDIAVLTQWLGGLKE